MNCAENPDLPTQLPANVDNAFATYGQALPTSEQLRGQVLDSVCERPIGTILALSGDLGTWGLG
jgi:hypothetical protein